MNNLIQKDRILTIWRYKVYEEVKSYSVDSYTVTLKGSNGLYNLAIWSDGEFSYALQLKAALSATDLSYIIQSIK